MPTPFPHPTTVGTVPAIRLEAVELLRDMCKRWAEPVPVHLPYIDLTFAFGFAVIGDPTRARRLLAEGVAALEGATPSIVGSRETIETTAMIIRRFLPEVFRFRVEQALAGNPHAGSLSGRALAAWNEIARRSVGGSFPNPYKLAAHAIEVYRMVSRVLEPVDRVDPYTTWTKDRDPLNWELVELQDVWDPGEVAGRLGQLIRNATASGFDGLRVIRDALPLALRADRAFAAEMLGLLRPILSDANGEAAGGKDPLVWVQSQFLERCLFVAGCIGRADLACEWADQLANLAERFPPESRVRLIRTAGPQCLRSLQALGLSDHIDRIITRLRAVIPEAHPGADPEAVGRALGAKLVLAAGWVTLGRVEEAAPVLMQARHALFGPDGSKLLSKDYTDLAQAYVFSIGQGPPDLGLRCLADLFRETPPGKVTNTSTTAAYFSRSHLILTEEAVAAACGLLLEPPPE